jgi:inhibitor of cysteine peptidase
MERKFRLSVILLMFPILMLVACGGSNSAGNESISANDAAMVDGVVVDFRDNHYYAVVNGFYPDSCTQISDVQQEVNGEKFKILLSTSRPGDLMCAQMLTEFEITLLLETGGLLPGQYTVEVNGRSTIFTLGEQ